MARGSSLTFTYRVLIVHLESPHLYSWYGSEKLCFLQTPSKNEQNRETKKPNHMPRTVKTMFHGPVSQALDAHAHKCGRSNCEGLGPLDCLAPSYVLWFGLDLRGHRPHLASTGSQKEGCKSESTHTNPAKGYLIQKV